MKGKASLFWTILSCLFVVLAFIERSVFEDIPAAVCAIVAVLFSAGMVFILVKLDKLIDIRMLEHELIRRLYAKKKVKRRK